MGLFDDLIPRGSLFADLIPPPAIGPMPGMPAAPAAVPPLAAPASLADTLMQAMAPPPAPPGVDPMLDTPENPVFSAPGWMDDRFGPGHITDMAAPVPVQPRPIDPDLQAAVRQAQQIVPGLGIFGGLTDIKQAGDHVVGGGLAEALGYAMDRQAQADLQEGLIGQGTSEIAAALPEYARRSDQIAALPMNDAAARVVNADTFGEGLSAAAEDPLGVLKTLGTRALGTSVPTILAAIAGSAVGGPIGAMLAPGAASGGIETAMSVGSAVEGALRQAGVDVTSSEAVQAWVGANPEAFDGLIETALGRAGVIASVDAATGGITGQLARVAARSGKPGTIAGHIAAGGVIEPIGEGVGEAGAQLATTGQIQPGDVLAEMLGGAGMGVPQTAGQVAVESMRTSEPSQAVEKIRTPPSGLFADLIPTSAAPLEPDVSPAVDPPVSPPVSPMLPEQEPDEPPAPPPSSLPPVQPEPEVSVAAPAPDAAGAPLPEPLKSGGTAVEPPSPQRKPFANLIRRAGIQVDPSGPAGQELKARGITPKTHPGLFRKGGHTDLDNIVASEHPEIAALAGQDTGYLAPAGLIDALDRETRGEFIAGADQQEIAAARRDWEALQDEQAQAWAAEPVVNTAPAAWRVVHPDDEFEPADRLPRVQAMVDEAVRSLGVTVTPAEISGIVDSLDRDGGDVEQAIERAIIRSIVDAESDEPLAIDIPGFEGRIPAEAPGPRAGDRGPAGREPTAEGGGDARAGEPRRAGSEDFQTELTPEGEQFLVPGTEQRQTGEAQRQRAEIDARQQQSKMRRGGQQRIEDDESSLFGEPDGELFDARASGKSVAGTALAGTQSAKTAPAGIDAPAEPSSGSVEDAAPSRRPPGRLSPRFLDFSFTNRTSVYGAAFRAAGVDPDEGRNLPIERQLGIAAKALLDTFGVRVELPNYKVIRKNLVGRLVSVERPQISTREALDQLLDAYRQMQMLAHIMGVPEKAMALELDGEPIVLSLVSAKRFGPLGAFSWGGGKRRITLPGRSNSFAHEWGHALDHYLSQTVRGEAKFRDMLSREQDERGVRRPMNPKVALADAFAGIMNAVFGDRAALAALQVALQAQAAEVDADGKPTPAARRATLQMKGLAAGRRPPASVLSAFFRSSQAYDKMTAAGGYFTDPAEMFARAFEAWVGRSVSAISDLPQGFLSKSAWGYDSDVDPRLAMTFPKGADAEAFAVAMLELQHAMSRLAIFGPGVAAKPADVDVYSPNALLMRLPRESMWRGEAEGWRTTANAIRTARSEVVQAVQSGATMANRVGLLSFRSTVGALHAVAARQESPEARRAIDNVADLIGTRPGSGRLLGNVYQTDVEMKARRLERMVDGALAKDFHGRSLTSDESAKLRSMLVEDGNPDGPAPLKRLAADLRTVLDTAWYELKDAGVEVGYASKYLPRITLLEKVDRAPDRFKAQAAKVYALMFRREVAGNADPDAQHADIKAVAGKLRSARMPTAEGESEPASRLSEQDENLYQAYLAARQKVRALQKEAEADPLNTRVGDRIAAAEAEFARQLEAVLDMLEARFATYSAENWYVSAKVGNLNDFGTLGPTSSFLKGRKLPAETDTLMADFMEANPVDLIRGYLYSAVRRAEYAKRFGARKEKLENMLRAAAAAGASTEATDLAKQAVLAATGRVSDRYVPLRGVRSAAFFWGNLVLLPLSAFTSIAEPITTGLRSGYTRDSLKAIVSNLRLAAQRGRREDLYEIARIVGLVNDALRDGYLENRTNADSVGMGRTANRLLARFYQLNLLSPLTNFQRVASLPVAHAIIVRQLRKAAGGARFADRELNELGIAAEDRPDLLQWLDGLQGMPTPDDLLAPDGGFYNRAAELWASAVVRFTDTVIQNPMKSDRPILANDPIYAPLYGIMSYLISFQRNIINRTIVRGVGDRETFMGKGGQVGVNLLNAAAPVTLLFAGHVLSTILREFLLNQQMWQEKEDDDELLEWLLMRALSRTGLSGAFEPLARAFVSLNYEKDLANIGVGPYASAWLKNAEAILRVASTRNSPNTNTAERAAAEAAYALIVQPVILTALAHAAPGGSLSALAFGTAPLWAVSRTGAREGFADLVAGPAAK